MEFIEEFVAGVIWVDEFGQLCAKDFDLFRGQDAYAGKITVGVEELDLIVGEAILLGLGSIEERRDRTVITGKVFDHSRKRLCRPMCGKAMPFRVRFYSISEGCASLLRARAPALPATSSR
jgi:hypothetical protein